MGYSIVTKVRERKGQGKKIVKTPAICSGLRERRNHLGGYQDCVGIPNSKDKEGDRTGPKRTSVVSTILVVCLSRSGLAVSRVARRQRNKTAGSRPKTTGSHLVLWKGESCRLGWGGKASPIAGLLSQNTPNDLPPLILRWTTILRKRKNVGGNEGRLITSELGGNWGINLKTSLLTRDHSKGGPLEPPCGDRH